MCKPYNNENREGFMGHVGFDHRGSSDTVFPSSPVIRGKGLSFMGTCGMLVVENLEVSSSLPSQSPLSSFPPSCGLTLPFLSPSVPILPSSVIQSQCPMENQELSKIFSKKDDVDTLCQMSIGNPNLDVVESQFAYLNQMPEGFNPLKSKPNLPNEVSNLVTVSQGDVEFSPVGKFQIEGFSLRKMAKVHEFLSSLDIKVYSRRKNRFSTGI